MKKKILVARLPPGKHMYEGYVVIRSNSGDDIFEHIDVAEILLERSLEAWEVVHRINGKRNDNRPENLCVMDRNAHFGYHKWYDWFFDTFGKHPRRETQLKKLREKYKGILLMDVLKKKTGS